MAWMPGAFGSPERASLKTSNWCPEHVRTRYRLLTHTANLQIGFF